MAYAELFTAQERRQLISKKPVAKQSGVKLPGSDFIHIVRIALLFHLSYNRMTVSTAQR